MPTGATGSRCPRRPAWRRSPARCGWSSTGRSAVFSLTQGLLTGRRRPRRRARARLRAHAGATVRVQVRRGDDVPELQRSQTAGSHVLAWNGRARGSRVADGSARIVRAITSSARGGSAGRSSSTRGLPSCACCRSGWSRAPARPAPAERAGRAPDLARARDLARRRQLRGHTSCRRDVDPAAVSGEGRPDRCHRRGPEPERSGRLPSPAVASA